MTSHTVLPGVTARCSSCGAAIIFGRTVAGKLMPLDAEPRADGLWMLEKGEVRAADMFATARYQPHWQACAQAAQHRRSR